MSTNEKPLPQIVDEFNLLKPSEGDWQIHPENPQYVMRGNDPEGLFAYSVQDAKFIVFAYKYMGRLVNALLSFNKTIKFQGDKLDRIRELVKILHNPTDMFTETQAKEDLIKVLDESQR